MKLTRRSLLRGMAGTMALAGAGISSAQAKGGLVVGEDGLHHQDWFVESLFDLRADLKEAADKGKHFVVLWEQRGCPYCQKLHEVNFAIPEIRKYVQDNFHILQLNFRGSQEIIDFDGTEITERKLAQRWRVNFTPTINFFPKDEAKIAEKVGREIEVTRMSGYFKPALFQSMFEYVRSERTKEIGFQSFVQERAGKRKKGGL